MKSYFYLWLVPLLWVVATVLLFFYPGDEYMCFYYGTQPASWICFYHHFGSLTNDFFVILPLGALVFAGLGFCLDRMNTNKLVFFSLLIIVAVAHFYYCGVADLGSLDRVQRKWTIAGFAGLSSNVALSIVIAVSFVVPLIRWLGRQTISTSRPVGPDA